MLNSDLDPIFEAAGQEWDLDPRLLKSVAMTESRGDPAAVSKAGARSIMGIMPDTAKDLGITDMRDPQQVIFGAAKYLAAGLKAEGTPEGALLYYHGGPGWRDAYGPESRAYVPTVGRFYQQFAGPGAPAGAAPAAAAQPGTADPSLPVPPQAAPQAPAGKGGKLDAFLAATGATPAGNAAPVNAAPAGDKAGKLDAFLASTGAQAAAAPDAPAGRAPAGERSGIAANAAAGVVTGGLSPLNALADPSGMLTTPLASLIVSGHDLLAPVFGYDRYTPEQRAQLLDYSPGGPGGGSIWSQPGTTLANLAGADKVVAATPAEQLVRGMATGAGGGFAMGGLPGMIAGGGAAAGAQVAGSAVPEYLAPAAEVAGGLVGGAAALGAPAAGRVALRVAGDNPLARAVNRIGNGPEPVPPPAPPPPPAPEPAPIPPDANLGPVPAPFVRREPAETSPVPPDLAPPPGATPPGAGPVPRSAGAAASGADPLQARQTIEARGQAEQRKLTEAQEIGVEDRNQYIEGVNPTLAQIEQQVRTSRERKALGMKFEAVSQDQKEVAEDHNNKRVQHFENLADSEVAVANDVRQAKTQLDHDVSVSFRNKGDADATPVLQAADAILAGPLKKRDFIRKTVENVRRSLFDENGNLERDPEMLWGVRQHINDLLEDNSKPEHVAAAAQLMQLKGLVDQAIEPAAPGFGQSLANYSHTIGALAAKSALQAYETKLRNGPGQTMTYHGVQGLMKRVVAGRKADAALNPWQGLTDEQMQGLWALRDDLRRSASAEDLAKAPGSDTAQNLVDLVKDYGRVGATGAIHGAANYLAPGVGSLGVRAFNQAVAPIFSIRRERQAVRRAGEIERPDPLKYPLRNPLAPP